MEVINEEIMTCLHEKKNSNAETNDFSDLDIAVDTIHTNLYIR